MVRVSVVIPCFNAGAWLRECVESVLAQDVPETEVVIVDDGSTDPGTADVLDEVAGDPAVRVIRGEHRDVSRARDFGFEQTSGRFVLFLDADDKLGEGFLRATVSALEGRPDCGVAFTDVRLFGAQTRTWRTGPLLFPGEIYLYNYLGIFSLVRRECVEAVGGFVPELVGFEDWDFWMKLEGIGVRFVKVRDAVAFYRKHPGSMVDTANEHWSELLHFMILNHKPAYGRLFGYPISAREERRVRELLQASADGSAPRARARLQRTRLYRQFSLYSAVYRACRRLLV